MSKYRSQASAFKVSLTSFSLKLLCAATFVAVGACAVVPTAIAADIKAEKSNGALKVIVDRAKVMRIARSARTIIVGNPLIADATIQDSRTIILTGRSYGVTNLIVLDLEGEPIVDETVVVGSAESNTVRIYRQAVRETFACSPVCEPTLTIGDNFKSYEESAEQIETRNKLSVPSE